jgi:hypothetical protein
LVVTTQVEEEDEDDDDFDWSDDDGPDPEKAAMQQRALLESFKSQKKLQEDNDADSPWRRTLPLAGAAAEHRRLLVMLCRERRHATQGRRRRGRSVEYTVERPLG